MKRKLLFTFVLILAVMSIQIAVFADMDAPSVKPYTATISDIDGVNYYDYVYDENSNESRLEKAGKLEYGDTIKIHYEQEIEDELYGHYYSGEEYATQAYYIKISDIKVLEENQVKLSEKASKFGTNAIVLQDGVELYKGPAYGYEKEGIVLKKGTEIELYSDEENAGNPWYFAKTDNDSGWICILNGAVGIKGADLEYFEKDKEIMSGKEINIYKDTTYTKVVGKIPANTKIENYLDIDDWSWGIYVEYKGISGYVQHEDYAINFPWLEENFEYIVNYPAKIYKEADLRSEVLVEELPLETKLEATYNVNTKMTTWIYVTYDGVSGWIFDVNELLSEGETYQDILDRELEYYELEENENVEYVENEIVSNEELEDEDVINKENQKDVITNEKDAAIYSISGTQIVLICVGFAVVLALTVFVTIILVNKNNKKAEETVDDKKEN